MTQTRKPPPYVRFECKDGVPDIARAASLALGILGHVRCDSWTGLREAYLAQSDGSGAQISALSRLALDDEELGLLEAVEPLLDLISLKPLVTLAVCPECSSVRSLSGWSNCGGTIPTSCRFTLDCPGKPVKGSRARKVEIPAEEYENAQLGSQPEAVTPPELGPEPAQGSEPDSDDFDVMVEAPAPGDLAEFDDDF